MSTPVTLFNLPASQIEEMRRYLRARSVTKPGMIVSSFLNLAIGRHRRTYFSDFPDPKEMTPEQRNREQIKLNLEYLHEHGVVTQYERSD
jgi:hypothetical protein